MNAAAIVETIQLIIAPVVLITACTLFQNGILARYTSLGQRIRSLAHERFELLHFGKTEDVFSVERLQAIDRQLPLLTHRHRLIQKSALLTYCAVAIFILTMFALAISVALSAEVVGAIALILFLVGTATFLMSIFLIALEIRISHQALCYEVHQIMSLS